MGQVTIYLDKELEQKMMQAAQAAHLSKSKWIARIIKQNINDEWPESISQLSGSWADFPSIDELRSKIGDDVPRETL
jgi:hypothetical protein